MSVPFNLRLLDPSPTKISSLLPVTQLDIYGPDGDYHPEGLYSTEIFGLPGEKERIKRFGYIDMKSYILHPKLYNELIRLKNLYAGILNGTAYATWDDSLKDFVKSDIIDGRTGYHFFMSHFDEIEFVRNGSLQRDDRIDLIEQNRKNARVRYLIVGPAAIRELEIDESGRPLENELNKLYRKILRVSNTISESDINGQDERFDTVRRSLQLTFNDIFQYVRDILEGKRGFILNTYASRAIHHGTRNVITAMDPSSETLGEGDAISVLDTVVGLHQFMKGSVDLAIHHVQTGPMSKVVESLPGRIPVIDPETLKTTYITPSQRTRDKWGNTEGIEDLINGFEKPTLRHKPVLIDGHYPFLIYRDDKSVRVLYDIDELPDTLNKDNVFAPTWGEMFYLSCHSYVKRVYGTVTRYPVTGSGSIYSTKLKLHTTTKGHELQLLDSSWTPMGRDHVIYHFPRRGEQWVEGMMVHPARTVGLGADYDGDMVSLLLTWAKETVQELDGYFDSFKPFLSPEGGLKMGANNHIVDLVLTSFSRGLENE